MTARWRWAWAWFALAASAASAGDDARPLLDAFKRRDQTDRRWTDRRQRVTFDIHDGGGPRRRSLALYERHAPDGSRMLLARILAPPSSEGFGLLVDLPAGRAGRKWFWGRAMNASRDASRSTLQQPLAESDLTYDDMELVTVLPGWGADEAESHARGTESVDGESCDVIDLTPKGKRTPYKRIRIWLGKASLLVRRLELSLDGTTPTKRITQASFDSGRVPVARHIKIETLGDSATTTDVTVTDTAFDVGIGEECFNKSTLEDPGRDADKCGGTSR